MKVSFADRLEAIDWIAGYVEDEGQFEVLREQLQFNFIYSGSYFLDLEKSQYDVILLNQKSN